MRGPIRAPYTARLAALPCGRESLLQRRRFLATAAAGAAWPFARATAQDSTSSSDMAVGDTALPDMVLGDAAAPIEIVEYASMTCHHCAAFHLDTLPLLKERYLDTGRARLVFREFPLDRVALTAAAIARCAGRERFFSFIHVLFETQHSWAHAADAVAAIERILRMSGQPPDMVADCLENRAIVDGILAVRLDGDRKYDIRSTPTFVIAGEVHAGHLSFEQFDRLLRAIEGDG